MKLALPIALLSCLLLLSCLSTSKPKVNPSVQFVNEYVNTNFVYLSDITQFGIDDYWQDPLEFAFNGSGDCEDYAIYKAHMLRTKYNIPKDQLSFLVMDVKNVPLAHMVLVFANFWVLDNNDNEVTPIVSLTDRYTNFQFFTYEHVEYLTLLKKGSSYDTLH